MAPYAVTREERLARDGFAGVEPVLFYRPRDPNGQYSSFSRHSVTLPNPWEPTVLVTHPTGEHPFQAGKAMTREGWNWIAAAPSAYEAKERGGPRGVELRPGWDGEGGIAYQVMLKVVRAKAWQHPEILRALLATGDRPIYEDSPTDDIWGWRFRDDYRGTNFLGRCWMESRELLRGAG